jgi:hypothetical protein
MSPSTMKILIAERVNTSGFPSLPPLVVSTMEYPSGFESAILDSAPFCYGPMNEIRLCVSLCGILDPFDFLEVGIQSPYGSSMHS